ncbi:restriction endonuclease subunit S [Anaerosalibacter sp. Marseille-P3206]|uniref:restriction endonuclease subunit S n=1 Tax=Anaerosalibacter sp. Marseille-P3206 TaxID=1871005 RepID=UPI00135655B8|nr:restriction endonuclease subunit S [Anaerosalibacter sp. Marseille-P3206]
MEKIDVSSWGEFNLNELFGKPTRGTRLKQSARITGEIPLVTAGIENQGIAGYISKGWELFTGLNITIDMFGNSFFRDYNFYADDNILVLHDEKKTENQLLYIVSTLHYLKSLYSYKDQYRLGSYKKTVIKLPQTSDGEPDWNYMDDFIREKKKKARNKFESIISVKSSKRKLDVSNWGEYKIEDVFPDIKRPAARSVKDYFLGDVPFISSGNYNNAVDSYCEPLPDEQLEKGNCISVSPVDGSTFYQPVDFLGRGGAGSSIILLYNDQLNEYNGLFISAVIRSFLSKKYAYGDMGNSTTIKKEFIKLPQTENGDVDWGYMEEFIKTKVEESKATIKNIGYTI